MEISIKWDLESKAVTRDESEQNGGCLLEPRTLAGCKLCCSLPHPCDGHPGKEEASRKEILLAQGAERPFCPGVPARLSPGPQGPEPRLLPGESGEDLARTGSFLSMASIISVISTSLPKLNIHYYRILKQK